MRQLREWYAISRDDQTGVAQLEIYDEIGGGWFSDGVTAKQWLDDMRSLEPDEPIDVRINSPGGLTTDAKAMYNLLNRHRGTVNVYVDGMAASAASYVAMAGASIIMAKNAMMMIHDPWGFTLGNAKAHHANGDVLEKESSALAHAYAEKSGIPEDEVLTLMDAETWYTADEAIEAGFADAQEPAMKLAACFSLERYPFKRLPHAFAAMMTTSPREVPHMTTPAEPVAPASDPPAKPPSEPTFTPDPATPDEVNVVDMAAFQARSSEVAELFALARIHNPVMQHELTTDMSLSMKEIRDKILEARAAEDERLQVSNTPAPPAESPVVAAAKAIAKKQLDLAAHGQNVLR
ncbi:MAG: head maturation protease, ClpP-related [Gammaproteobacteria bacterium]